jgi:acetyltransferase-like isoleucine patch superfamily enzyme
VRDAPLRGALNRFLQWFARFAPGAMTLRVRLHRLRGVRIGEGVFIGTDALIETAYPHLVEIGNHSVIGIRSVTVAHFRGRVPEGSAVRIEDQVFVGPGCIILPNVTLGYGSVVTAGSVVTKSVPPLTMVQGNPAKPIAECGLPLGMKTPVREFYRQLRPLPRPSRADD